MMPMMMQGVGMGGVPGIPQMPDVAMMMRAQSMAMSQRGRMMMRPLMQVPFMPNVAHQSSLGRGARRSKPMRGGASGRPRPETQGVPCNVSSSSSRSSSSSSRSSSSSSSGANAADQLQPTAPFPPEVLPEAALGTSGGQLAQFPALPTLAVVDVPVLSDTLPQTPPDEETPPLRQLVVPGGPVESEEEDLQLPRPLPKPGGISFNIQGTSVAAAQAQVQIEEAVAAARARRLNIRDASTQTVRDPELGENVTIWRLRPRGMESFPHFPRAKRSRDVSAEDLTLPIKPGKKRRSDAENVDGNVAVEADVEASKPRKEAATPVMDVAHCEHLAPLQNVNVPVSGMTEVSEDLDCADFRSVDGGALQALTEVCAAMGGTAG